MTAFARGRGYRLALEAQPVRGAAGERFGKGAGSSLEFHEFRDYQAGDDLRHIDWRAYARTETLTTRLYREEIAATVELLVDGSRSMAIDADKLARSRELAGFLAGAASGDHSLRAFSGRDEWVAVERDHLPSPEAWEFDGSRPLVEMALEGVLRAGTVRIVLSDFLFPCDPRALVRKLRGRAHRLLMVQLLSREERQPSRLGQLLLDEVETGRERELPVDDATIRRYLDRLERHQDCLRAEAERAGAGFVSLTASDSLDQMVQEVFLPAEVVVPR